MSGQQEEQQKERNKEVPVNHCVFAVAKALPGFVSSAPIVSNGSSRGYQNNSRAGEKLCFVTSTMPARLAIMLSAVLQASTRRRIQLLTRRRVNHGSASGCRCGNTPWNPVDADAHQLVDKHHAWRCAATQCHVDLDVSTSKEGGWMGVWVQSR